MGPLKRGRIKQVVAIRRWSLTQVWLYILTKYNYVLFEQKYSSLVPDDIGASLQWEIIFTSTNFVEFIK